MKGIQVCSSEEQCSFPRGDYDKIAKIHWRNLKIFFSRTTGPISTKLGTKHLLVICTNEDSCPFLTGGNYKIGKRHGRNLKIYWANFSQTWQKASLGEKNLSLLKLNGHTSSQRETITKLLKCIDEILKMFSSRTTEPILWYIIIALLIDKCIHRFELVSQESYVAHGPLVFGTTLLKVKLFILLNIKVM